MMDYEPPPVLVGYIIAAIYLSVLMIGLGGGVLFADIILLDGAYSKFGAVAFVTGSVSLGIILSAIL